MQNFKKVLHFFVAVSFMVWLCSLYGQIISGRVLSLLEKYSAFLEKCWNLWKGKACFLYNNCPMSVKIVKVGVFFTCNHRKTGV